MVADLTHTGVINVGSDERACSGPADRFEDKRENSVWSILNDGAFQSVGVFQRRLVFTLIGPTVVAERGGNLRHVHQHWRKHREAGRVSCH